MFDLFKFAYITMTKNSFVWFNTRLLKQKLSCTVIFPLTKYSLASGSGSLFGPPDVPSYAETLDSD